MKVSDKLKTTDGCVNVVMMDVGFTVEVGGNNRDGDWGNFKTICVTFEDLAQTLKDISELPRN